MTDWREQLRDCINNREGQTYSWSNRNAPIIDYTDRAFSPSPEEITQFLKDIGHDCNHSR